MERGVTNKDRGSCPHGGSRKRTEREVEEADKFRIVLGIAVGQLRRLRVVRIGSPKGTLKAAPASSTWASISPRKPSRHENASRNFVIS